MDESQVYQRPLKPKFTQSPIFTHRDLKEGPSESLHLRPSMVAHINAILLVRLPHQSPLPITCGTHERLDVLGLGPLPKEARSGDHNRATLKVGTTGDLRDDFV